MRCRSMLVLVALAAGCLPRGEPPAGRQLLATRDDTRAIFVPAVAGQPRRLLVLRRLQPNADDQEIQVAEMTGATPGPLRLLARDVSIPIGTSCFQSGDCGSLDDTGRLFLRGFRAPDANGISELVLFRFDLTTGAREDLGPALDFNLSPSHGRVLLRDSDGMHTTVRDTAGHVTTLENVGFSQWSGEDLFYLQTQPPTRDGAYSTRGTLFVLRADGSTAHVADDIDQVQATGSGAVPVLVLVRQPTSGSDAQYAVLDPVTLAITPLAMTSTYTSFDFSPDGHWAAVMAATPGEGDVHPRWKLTMIDRRSGDTRDYPLDAQQGIVQPSWRPGHDEAWFRDGPHVFVWRAGAAALADLPVFPYTPSQAGPNASSQFTADGAHCFVYDGGSFSQFMGQFGTVYLASADDPAGPRLRLNPPGTGLADLRQMDDGRLLARAWTTLPERGDLFVVDPNLGTIRNVATGSEDLDVRQGRLLALQHLVDRAGTGDLVMIDLATGAQTLLAENAGRGTIDSAGLAPGAPVAFAVHSALPSPYDGLWLAELP